MKPMTTRLHVINPQSTLLASLTAAALGTILVVNPSLAVEIFPMGDAGLALTEPVNPALARQARHSPKLTFGLAALKEEYRSYQEAVDRGRDPTEPFSSKRTMARIANELVIIDAVAEDDDPQRLARALRELGAEVSAVAGRLVSASYPLDRLDELEREPTLHFARLSVPITRSGVVITQGDLAQGSDVARDTFDLDGAGSKVGVLSDSFDCAGTGGGYAADVDTGDLPAGVSVIDDLAAGCTDEGRAMAQIIHDVAPGAALAFHTAFNGEADFAQGIIDLADAGSNIIVDDVSYLAEPMFQDGVIAQAVDEVDARGVAYFSSAGNNGRQAYQAEFSDSPLTGPLGGVLHDFNPEPEIVDTRLAVNQNSDVTYILQWQDPFFSVSGHPGASSDLGICFYYSGLLLGCPDTQNVGFDPLEGASINLTGNVEISIERLSGPNPGAIKVVMFGSMSFADSYTGTESGTVYGHSNAAAANAVGASAYFLTPFFGEDPPVLNYYSSAGNTPILFDTDGEGIFPAEIRDKPEFTAPDGGNNTFFGVDYEPDDWPNFFGTSASAPHAAAVASLMRDADPALAPHEITGLLQLTAIDISERETLGFGGPRVSVGADYDNDSGAGLIDAVQAVTQVIVIDDECDLTVSPDLLNFGSVAVGETATEHVELRNLGDATCTVTALSITGDQFALNPDAPDVPFALGSGAEPVWVPLDYTPDDANADSGILGIVSNDSEDSEILIDLSGVGVVTPQEADLALTKADWPDPAKIDSELTYTITVTNLGPGTASEITMTDKLPSRIELESVTADAGACFGTTTITCDLASLDAGGTWVIEIVVEPTRQGRLSNTASVEGSVEDPDTSNNSATEITRVRPSRR
jgi:uncharacterized repeat protein (TIGR01451 family)